MTAAWRGRMSCSAPGCEFVVYAEGEMYEEGIDRVIGAAIDAHLAIDHPGTEGLIQPLVPSEAPIEPPDGAFGQVIDENEDPKPAERPRLLN